MELIDISHIIAGIADFQTHLFNILLQPATHNNERDIRCQEFAQRILHDEKNNLYSDPRTRFNRINVHFIQQTWGNTSGGWQGIGGSAMTQSYTLIIENAEIGFAAIYYHGRLAYVIKIDEKYQQKKELGFRNMPGMRDATGLLDVLFLVKR